jgi:DNA-binding beta-propeller fold protein YncE
VAEPFRTVVAASCLGALLALSGCGSDAWWGDGPGAEAAVTTPAGIQTGNVSISYTLTGEMPDTDISASFSTDGTSYRKATAAPGGEGTENLSVSTLGDPHVFLWDSGADLDGARESSVFFRIHPDGGVSDTTSAMTVHNARFLTAVEDRDPSRVRFYRLDAVDGGLVFRQSVLTGGEDAYGVVHSNGFYFIAHQTSNDVAVLALDEDAETLGPVGGSPFACDGSGSKYLAADEDRVYVSNATGGTVTVFDIDETSGALTLNPHSGVSAPGARDLAIWSGHLYVASQTGGSILIFDIMSDGELLPSSLSPFTGGGLASPRALAVAGTRLYVANHGAASLSGFNFQGGGGLSVIAGSPFALSSAGVEELSRNGSKLFAAGGSVLLSLTIDSFGAVTEDAGSPVALTGPSFTVGSAGAVTTVATTTSESFELWTIDGSGVITAAPSSPIDAAAQILRIAISD